MQNITRAIILLGIACTLGGLPFGVKAKAVLAQTPSSQPTQAPNAQKSADQLFKQGSDQIASKDYRAAIETFTQVLQLNPKDADSYYNRGLAYAQLKEYKEAIADCTQALQLNPKDVDSYYRRGLARNEIADNSGAVADFSEVLKQKPDDAKAYLNRGLAYAELNQDNKAIADFHKASDLFAQQGKTDEAQEAISLIKKLQSQPARR